MEVLPREDTHGPSRQLEEIQPELVEWEASDTPTEERRMATDTELKPKKLNPNEHIAICHAYPSHEHDKLKFQHWNI